LLAQLVEQVTLNHRVVGSIPTQPTYFFSGILRTVELIPSSSICVAFCLQNQHTDESLIPVKQAIGLTRYAVFVPALASIFGAILLMAQGSIAIVMVVVDAVLNDLGLKETIVEVLTAIDAILLGTVLLVIGYGLYELFIDTDIQVPLWLRVEDLDDLKSKLIGVVVAILAVVFVGVFVDSNRSDDVISYGVGAGALVVGLAIFAFATRKKDES
jgi:uncharacterized membrane protein YqhA